MKKHFRIIGILICASASCAWTKSETVDRITGKKLTLLMRTAVDTSLYPPRREMKKYPPAQLVFQCESNLPSIFLTVPGYLVAGRGTSSVTYRFDDQKPVASSTWKGSADSSGIGIWSKSAVAQFVKSAIGKKQLLFRSEYDAFGTVEAEIDMTDFADAISDVRKSCSF